MAMYENKIEPRFSETDALGHVGNTALPIWFEACRNEFFKLGHPSLNLDNWPFILAKMEFEFKAQLFWPDEVTVKTGIERMGNSSMVVYQEAWQKGVLTNIGRTVMVWFDYNSQSTCPIPIEIRESLSSILVENNHG